MFVFFFWFLLRQVIKFSKFLIQTGSCRLISDPLVRLLIQCLDWVNHHLAFKTMLRSSQANVCIAFTSLYALWNHHRLFRQLTRDNKIWQRRAKSCSSLSIKAHPFLPQVSSIFLQLNLSFLFSFFFLCSNDEVVFVCAESTLLVCDNKKESDTQTRRLPPNGTPLTAPHPPSQRTTSNSSQVFKFTSFFY